MWMSAKDIIVALSITFGRRIVQYAIKAVTMVTKLQESIRFMSRAGTNIPLMHENKKS